MKRVNKKILCVALAGMLAASMCAPVSAAWDDPEYYYDYYVQAEEFPYFYPESTAIIYHDGHGNFTTSGSGIISSEDGVITVIPPSTGNTDGTVTDNNGYPVVPPGWQGSGTSGGGSYTDSSILQYNGVLGRLNIKGRNITVYEGTDDTTLLYGAGHFTGTSAWDGNVCLAGHNRGPNAWFSQLISLNYGDIITYSTALGVRVYQVTGTRIVSVNDLSPLNGSTENMLTLVTCLANQPSVRLIVTAREI